VATELAGPLVLHPVEEPDRPGPEVEEPAPHGDQVPGAQLAEELQLELERRHPAALLPLVGGRHAERGEELEPGRREAVDVEAEGALAEDVDLHGFTVSRAQTRNPRPARLGPALAGGAVHATWWARAPPAAPR
jgi:hypothetical protein